jgi:hypothetical protein
MEGEGEEEEGGVEGEGEGESGTDSAEPSISNSALVRVLKLCGLNAPPPKLTYRTSNGIPIEYSGNKLPLSEYLDFADVYIDDTGLQVFLPPSLDSLSLSVLWLTLVRNS